MAMYMCRNCDRWVSSTEVHKCSKKPIVLNVLNKKEVKKDNPFFKGYKPDFYFKTDKRY